MCERIEINGVEKLVPNLRDKKNYVIHIQALNQALQDGLRSDRVHRVIEFNQSPWLKTYIDFNTQLRTAATNDFEKDQPSMRFTPSRSIRLPSTEMMIRGFLGKMGFPHL